MTIKILNIFKEGFDVKVELNKERLILGRDKTCDIVIKDKSMSRKHAAFIHRFESVYVENVSATGRITKDGSPVEYAELKENEEIHIGSYLLKWNYAAAVRQEAQPISAPAEGVNNELQELGQENAAVDQMLVASEPVDVLNTQVSDENKNLEVASIEDDNQKQDFDKVSGDGKTEIVDGILRPCLRITRGEERGREIRLDHGATWIVGRSAQCQVQIEDPKISRQHFRIVKIQNTFRVQDLGSSKGTRLNGVSVSDAPLQAFDTLQAGSVEMQFLLVDAKLAELNTGAMAAIASVNKNDNPGSLPLESEADRTQIFSAPVPYSTGNTFANADSAELKYGEPIGVPPGSPSDLSNTKNPVARTLQKAKVWFKEQPKQRQILVLVALVAAAGALAFLAVPQSNSPEVAVVVKTPKRDPAAKTADNKTAAKNKEVADDFSKLSPEKQNQVKDLYAKAERALAEKNYKDAYENITKVLDIVKPYKSSNDILDQAQDNLNADRIGLIAKSLTSVHDAAIENDEKLQLLIEEGKKALADQRYSDAAEYFQRAIALDPANPLASQGLAAAISHNPKATVKLPDKPPPEPDPEIEELQQEKDEIAGLRQQLQIAKVKINNGSFREALPVLKDLDGRVQSQIEEYDTGRRGPASQRSDLSQESRVLSSQVKESLEVAKSQLRIEYHTQFTDAEQFISNKQYVQAREIYDRIVSRELAFDEPKQLRQKLYSKMLAEAKSIYQEALIYESIGDLNNAAEGFQKTKELLTNVRDVQAVEYYKKALSKLKRLQP